MDLSYFLKLLNHTLEELVGINCTRLGLDMEPSSVALVQLSGSFSDPKLTRFDIQKLSAGVLSDEHIYNANALEKALSQLVVETHIRKKSNVSIAAPGSLVISKKVPLKEGFPLAELDVFAWTEARKAFPGLSDNLYLDYLPTSDNKLLLVAARKKELQDRLDAIANSGLIVESIDVDYYALARAYFLIKNQIQAENLKEEIGLINIDSNALLLNVFKNDESIFFHRQTHNGAFLADYSNRVIDGQTPDADPLSPAVKEALETQVKRLVQFFQTELPGRKLSQIILSGRLALIPLMRELVENALGVPTQLANPITGMRVDFSLRQKFERVAPMLMMSCGLAMRGLR